MKHLKLYEKFKNEKLKTIELTSNLLNIAEVGMYETRLSPDDLFASELDNLTEDEMNKFNDKFDNDKYKKWILEKVENYTMKELDLLDVLKSINPHIKTVTFDKIWSPKYYNYGNDELYFNLNVENGFDKYILDDIEEMGYYVSPHKSHPGFSSMMPQNIDDLKAVIESGEDYERSVAAWIEEKLAETEYYFETDEFVDYILSNDYKHPLDFTS